MDKAAITLVGDGIENPWNAQTMLDAAVMFDTACVFRDRGKLAQTWLEETPAESRPKFISCSELAHDYSPIVAFDNLEGASDVYGFRLTGGPQPAVVVGNERRGLSHDIEAIAGYRVQIPMFVRQPNCLNVAAASAVALYYLSRGGGAGLQMVAHPAKRRPELMMLGVQSHVELGSAIRSAGAFGWKRVLLEDRMKAWFGVDRGLKAEGRAAARMPRNPIRLVSASQSSRYAFNEVCIVTTKHVGKPIHKANLAGGTQQLVAIPDESVVDIDAEDWSHLGKEVRFIHLDLPTTAFVYHYRLTATIALAEIARQVGQRTRPSRAGSRREPFYDSSIILQDQIAGETIFLDELECY